MNGKTVRRACLLALFVGVLGLLGSLALDHGTRAGGGLEVDSYTVNGRYVSVRLYNSGPATAGSASALVDLGSGTESNASFASMIGEGEYGTVVIVFSGPVVGIIEGPDPIPQ